MKDRRYRVEYPRPNSNRNLFNRIESECWCGLFFIAEEENLFNRIESKEYETNEFIIVKTNLFNRIESSVMMTLRREPCLRIYSIELKVL